jgi:hypothetical protein
MSDSLRDAYSRTFSLIPFPASDRLPDIEIAGKIIRHKNTLAIHYILHGNLAEVDIPTQADRRKRQDNLWEATCFEFFFSMKDYSRYWEFNLSPSGHWNVYRFDGYRQGMQEEMAFLELPFVIQMRSDALSLSLDLDLDRIVQEDRMLEVAISTVTRLKDDRIFYWALIHPVMQADFHDRKGFILKF